MEPDIRVILRHLALLSLCPFVLDHLWNALRQASKFANIDRCLYAALPIIQSAFFMRAIV